MERKTPINTDPYYNSLIESYTKSILNSGLLLDEDLEVLLSFLKPNSAPTYKYKPSLNLPACVLTLIGSAILAKKLGSKVMLVPSVIISALCATAELLHVKRRKNEERIIDKLVFDLRAVHKLNNQIVLYTKARQELKPGELLLHSKTQEFFQVFSEEKRIYSGMFINALHKIGSTTNVLTDDLDCLKSIDFPDSLSLGEYNPKAYLDYSKRVLDIQIWFTSKLLGYIGIALNSLDMNDLKLLLELLPQLLDDIERHYVGTARYFKELRESVSSWSEFKSQYSSRKLISSKLDNTIACVIDSLSLISERSMAILSQIDDNKANVEELNNSLLDLRRRTLNAYESVDLLCKLHGIISNTEDITEVEYTPKPVPKCDSDGAVSMVRYDDQAESLEEQFDLYIDKDDTEETQPTKRYSGDESGAFIGLMLHELKQSLGQHERFKRAKLRRGSTDEESEKVARVIVPKFDLAVLRSESSDTQKCLKTDGVGVDLPPPLPPPLPPKLFDLSSVEELTGHDAGHKSMFEGIKALSCQLSGSEEVFGAD